MTYIKMDRDELNRVMATLSQALEALLFSEPVAQDARHKAWHREAIEEVQLTLTNLRRFQ